MQNLVYEWLDLGSNLRKFWKTQVLLLKIWPTNWVDWSTSLFLENLAFVWVYFQISQQHIPTQTKLEYPLPGGIGIASISWKWKECNQKLHRNHSHASKELWTNCFHSSQTSVLVFAVYVHHFILYSQIHNKHTHIFLKCISCEYKPISKKESMHEFEKKKTKICNVKKKNANFTVHSK